MCDLLDRGARTFADVGCGAGSVSLELCRRGMKGIGIDRSADAVRVAGERLAEHIAAGRYEISLAEVEELPHDSLDVAISLMVAEHLHDDVGFVHAVARLVRRGGQVIIGVPGRRDHWGYEDEVAGHLRRYERDELRQLLESAGLEEVVVWSVAVPVANLLYRIGNRLVRRSTSDDVASQTQREQTDSSGIREVPWKTVFPRWCGLILNRYTLAPLFLVQRAFYRSALGITLLASGRRSSAR